jgi:hypothetical protein
MRRILPLLCLMFAGCNAPVAAFMDTCFPSRAKATSDPAPGVDVRPNPVDPIRPGPPPPPGPNPPIPPPDFGPGQ